EILGYTNIALPEVEQRSVIGSLLHYASEGRLRLSHDLVALEEVREAWGRQSSSPHAKVLLQLKSV
ncbi:MAG: hypothetical protein ACYDES_14780, partial [Acidimicrobiales bacterium]